MSFPELRGYILSLFFLSKMLDIIKKEIQKPYMVRLQKKLARDKNRIPKTNPFRILEIADLYDIKMVIIGQDPYATGIVEFSKFKLYYDGIAFSSANTLKTPYSLKILHRWFINTERQRGNEGETSNDLTYLVERGVLLINTLWTTSFNKPGSHMFPEWYDFTAFIMKLIQHYNDNVVFLLLGNEAQRMEYAINQTKHKVFSEMHPAASRYKANRNLFDSDILLKAMKSLTIPIRLLK
jgi:uracil-DNA glycosylase